LTKYDEFNNEMQKKNCINIQREFTQDKIIKLIIIKSNKLMLFFR